MFSPSSIVSGIFLPLVSGRRYELAAPMRERTPKMTRGNGSQTLERSRIGGARILVKFDQRVHMPIAEFLESITKHVCSKYLFSDHKIIIKIKKLRK